jgi:hypothetical protein
MLAKGVWYLSSKIDPRWNSNGDRYVGGFSLPPRCAEKIKELTELYGPPPDDLSQFYYWECLKN